MKTTLHGRMKIGTAEEKFVQDLNFPNAGVKIFNRETGRDIPNHAKINSLRKKKSKS